MCLTQTATAPAMPPVRHSQIIQGICCLLFDNLKNIHGAGLGADTAGNALGSGILGLQDHDLHGADFDTLAAADTLLLVDHENAGLGVLGNGLVFTGLRTLATLNADIGLGTGTLCNNPNATQVRIELLVKSGGASTNTFQTSHALNVFFYCKFLHSREYSFFYVI